MFKSLRCRLQAWHTLILLLVVAGFGGTLYVEAPTTVRRDRRRASGRARCSKGCSNRRPLGSMGRASIGASVRRTAAPAPRPPAATGLPRRPTAGPPPAPAPRPRAARNAADASAPAAVPAQRTHLAAFIHGSILPSGRRALFRRARRRRECASRRSARIRHTSTARSIRRSLVRVALAQPRPAPRSHAARAGARRLSSLDDQSITTWAACGGWRGSSA